MTPTPDQFDELLATMKQLLEAIPSHRDSVKRAWRGTVSAIFVGLAALLMAFTSYASVNDIQALRTETTISACLQANELLDRQRNVLIASVRTLFHDELTAEERAKLDDYTSVVEEFLPDRDCTQAGIREFYTPPPATLPLPDHFN